MTTTGKTRLWKPGIAGIVAFASLLNFAPVPALAQSSTTAKSGIAAGPRRLADGKPDLNGIWQSLNTANWDIQGHTAAPGPIAALGAAFFVPSGLGVVEGEEIPYTPAAAVEHSHPMTLREWRMRFYINGLAAEYARRRRGVELPWGGDTPSRVVWPGENSW